jgi:uncharacterized protein (DUF1330 family)
MTAYFVAIRESVRDESEMSIYMKKAAATTEGFAITPKALYGRLRMGDGESVDGVVILEFPSFEEAEAWYDSPAYQEAMKHRLRGGTYRTFITQGVA